MSVLQSTTVFVPHLSEGDASFSHSKVLQLFCDVHMASFPPFSKELQPRSDKYNWNSKVRKHFSFLMSFVSRFNPCQFLFDCPPLPLSCIILACHHQVYVLFSDPPPAFFSPCIYIEINASLVLSAKWKPKVITALCFTAKFFSLPFRQVTCKKPHCLDTGRCTKLCLLSLWIWL